MQCIRCNKTIPELRLKALPNTKTCTDCSETQKVAGFPVISGKTTYSELQIVSSEKAAELYQQQDRKNGVSEGVKFRNTSTPNTSNLE
jgi:hypothetical protein